MATALGSSQSLFPTSRIFAFPDAVFFKLEPYSVCAYNLIKPILKHHVPMLYNITFALFHVPFQILEGT